MHISLENYVIEHITMTAHCPIRMLCNAGRLIQSWGAHNNEADPVSTNADFVMSLIHNASPAHPTFHVELSGVIYGVVKTERNTNENYLFGPVCFEENLTEIEHKLKQQHKIVSEQSFLTYCNLQHFCSSVLLLHNVLNKNTLMLYELYNLIYSIPDIDDKVLTTRTKEFFEYQEYEVLRNPYGRELRERIAIKNGDSDALLKALNEPFVGRYGKLAEDELRSHKNLGILGVFLGRISAIEGGVLHEVASTMLDGYVRLIEDVTQISEVDIIVRKAKFEFLNKVVEKMNIPKDNPLITSCMSIIQNKMHSKITVKELAAELGVHPDYLSNLFHKLTGTKLMDYITAEKINRSKDMLAYSEYSCIEIAYYLGFSSQSYYSYIFKKNVGMTPSEYRNIYGMH
ncbi:MAG: helix-turn-helix transcriptional regulator [Oscillospiraceae bacterium]|nr:helix-turn-helix transcriptional regulator [Oscillospiraceae bacterium]MCL2278374.1 helix-turn-helix transcriptional regulator [Oscillospiraceae bacterium]